MDSLGEELMDSKFNLEKKEDIPDKKEIDSRSAIASQDTQELIAKINTLFEEYLSKESILGRRQKELVLRRAISFLVANSQFKGARVSIHISDELGYGWEQTQ